MIEVARILQWKSFKRSFQKLPPLLRSRVCRFRRDLIEVIDQAIEDLSEAVNPDGFNIGMNCGETAGQTVFPFHCHVIPRREGDVEDPRGGIRHAVMGEGYY